jgi:hypothetical protein
VITHCFEDAPDGRSKQGIVIDDMNNCRQGNLTGMFAGPFNLRGLSPHR